MKNILVLSKYFAPENAIAAIRPTKLIKYLKKSNEYSFTVITVSTDQTLLKDQLLESDLQYADRIITVSEDNFFSKFLNKIILTVKKRHMTDTALNEAGRNPENGRILHRKLKGIQIELWNFIKFYAEYQCGKNYFRNAKKCLKNQQIDYDIIFSTYGPYATHLIARYAKKRNPGAFWIADFRDGTVNDFLPLIFRHYSLNYPNRVCGVADVITAVSQGVIDELGIKTKVQKKVIPNGYDKDDIQNIERKQTHEKFTLTYTGLLYNGRSDLSVLFKIIHELIEDRVIDGQNVLIQYAGTVEARFMEQIKPYNLKNSVVSYGYLKREEALKLQLNSDILLLASWNTAEKTGIVTGKLLEYMMTDRPVVSIVSGEIPNSKIKEITTACNLGFCYEQANSGKNYDALKKYILQKYTEYLNEGVVKHTPNREEIEKYSYEEIAHKLNLLFPVKRQA